MRPPPRLILALVCGFVLIAAGCGSKDDSNAPARPAKAAAAKKPLTPVDQLSPNLVPAVATGKAGTGLLQVRFELSGRPVVGEAVDIDLVVVPTADNIDSISGTVQGDDGLDVVAGGTLASIDKPTYGNPVHRPLKVLAKHDGIYTLTATMSVESGGQLQSAVFTMPVIGGNGLSEAAGVPAGSNSARASAAPAAH